MSFGEKLRRAFAKIKGKLIVAAILVIAIIIFGIAFFTVALQDGIDAGPNIGRYFDWQVFFESCAGIMHPGQSLKLAFSAHYFPMFWNGIKVFLIIYFFFIVIGVTKAFPKHEYDDIEHGSSDWSENGEQYRILNKKKGIILAEKNYLPVDKRGNVNVLVVRRFWCW